MRELWLQRHPDGRRERCRVSIDMAPARDRGQPCVEAEAIAQHERFVGNPALAQACEQAAISGIGEGFQLVRQPVTAFRTTVVDLGVEGLEDDPAELVAACRLAAAVAVLGRFELTLSDANLPRQLGSWRIAGQV